MTTTPIRDLLAGHRFFAGLEPAIIDLIAGCGTIAVVRAGSVLAREGAPADQFYVVRDGRAAIEIEAPGRGGFVVATAGPGDVLGWSWLFPPHRWSVDVRAVTDLHVIALDGACLRGKCDDDPRLGYQLMKRFSSVVVAQLEATRLRLLDLYGDTQPISPGGEELPDAH